jgi:ABC-type sugar transport system ATPase subunit
MAEVVLENVCKTYESGSRAVDRFSLVIRDSEFLVLVGPSGCGKSTTLRMIAGLEEITSGTVSIGGRCVNSVPPKDRDIAMVFQNYALYPHMTVYDNMAFGLKLRGLPRREIEARVRELGPVLGSYHPVISYNVQRLKAISGLDEVSFHMSGTEAVMAAVRLARFNTGRKLIVRSLPSPGCTPSHQPW